MITEKLADFVVERSDIPEEALRVAQIGITDSIGVTFPGGLEPATGYREGKTLFGKVSGWITRMKVFLQEKVHENNPIPDRH